jgi:transposase-like protein
MGLGGGTDWLFGKIPFPRAASQARKGFLMPSQEEIESMSDNELAEAIGELSRESAARAKRRSRIEKAAMSKAAKRDPRCPKCHVALGKDGRRHDGVQRYRCPSCGAEYSDSSFTSMSSSKLTPAKIGEVLTLIMLDCPDWVVAWICRVNIRTAQYWRDRCLDAAVAWSKETRLSGHVWMDEMRFAPTRSTGLIDGVWTTYGGKIAKDTYMEVAFDSNGQGFCKVYDKLGMPTRDMVLDCCRERIEATAFKEDGKTMVKGTTLTHDGAPCHNLTVKTLRLTDDWHKFVRGDKDYEKAMLIMSNCCSYLRHEFESHRGIKYAKLEAYGDFFMWKWSHVRKYGLRKSIDYLFSRVSGTPKSHRFADMFSKMPRWS